MHAIPHLILRADLIPDAGGGVVLGGAVPAVVAELSTPVGHAPFVTVYIGDGFAISVDLDTADALVDALVDATDPVHG